MNEKREKLTITKQQAQAIIWGDSLDFEVIEDKPTGNSRWSQIHQIIIKRLSDNKFFKDKYSIGATEHQEENPYEYSEPNFTEVFPVEKVVIVYE